MHMHKHSHLQRIVSEIPLGQVCQGHCGYGISAVYCQLESNTCLAFRRYEQRCIMSDGCQWTPSRCNCLTLRPFVAGEHKGHQWFSFSPFPPCQLAATHACSATSLERGIVLYRDVTTNEQCHPE